jgi:uncharacterized membrane protein YsdA (DUF1294 family)
MIIPGLYAAMSLATFIAFLLDKRAARLDRRRTPERTLHLLELLGGWPGALAAAYLIRHKNRKAAYMAILFLIAIGHAAAWAAYWWVRAGSD